MQSNKPLFIILGLLVVIACLHIAGIYFHLYWRLPEYDRVVHPLAGLWVALAAFFISTKIGISISQKKYIVIIGIGSALVVGILWELFELKSGVTALGDQGFIADTVGDIISDIIGGLIGSLYGIKQFLVWNKTKQQ